MLGLGVNKNPCPHWERMLFALAALGDGLVRTLSFGLVFTNWPLSVARSTARRSFTRLKAKEQS